MLSPRIAVPVAIVAVAALSLLAPFQPLYDPWGWLVWGREVLDLDLDTGAGPSWKPLAAMLATVIAPLGDGAPDAWLWIARVGWLAAIALAYRLAWRLMFPVRVATGLATRFAPARVRLARNLAGAIAALGLVLLHDPFTSWARQFAGGLSEPLLVALVLSAVDRELSERRGQALALGFAAALLRPEAWPFLAAYGIWLWRDEPRLRPWLAGATLALPVLWLVPDLLASGDALTGAERAREGTGSPPVEALEVLWRSFELPLAVLWAGAVIAVATAWAHRERELLVLAAGAVAWIAVVAVLAAIGYAGLPRFAAPAAAVVCVLGGVGLVRLVAAADGMGARDRWRRPALALVGGLAVVLVVQVAVRVADIPGELDRARADAVVLDRLDGAIAAVGVERLRACARPVIHEFLLVPPLAWRLELPMTAIDVETPPAAGPTASYEVSCPAASAASGSRIALVGGASRYGGSSTSSSSR